MVVAADWVTRRALRVTAVVKRCVDNRKFVTKQTSGLVRVLSGKESKCVADSLLFFAVPVFGTQEVQYAKA